MATDNLIPEEEYSQDLSPIVDPAGETPVSIILIRYNQDELIERSHISAVESQAFLSDSANTWIHVQGQPKPSTMLELGRLFHLHPLAIEDVINLGERSKTVSYENQLMTILGMPIKKGNKIINEQVSFFLAENFLVSFHNGEHDPFRAVRRRLHHAQGPLRSKGLDYLLYVLVDVVLDHCFPVLDEFDEDIQEIEQQLLGPEGVDTFKGLYTIKRELLVLRLKIRPQREAIRALMRDDNNWLSEETKLYLRDCFDHVSRLIDIIEIYRDMTSNMLDVHLSLVNNKTFISNEVQRKATVWAMIFSPLTFLTGIYGMNFVHIPELDWQYGFLLVVGFMALLGFLLVWLFKRHDWL